MLLTEFATLLSGLIGGIKTKGRVFNAFGRCCCWKFYLIDHVFDFGFVVNNYHSVVLYDHRLRFLGMRRQGNTKCQHYRYARFDSFHMKLPY
ncbi:MAG: hypothetical protein JL55_37345 [Pseudomonas sp. BICA1-14]|nr:MAG: hypothetical protein VR76_15950 [Pseudomonas sp. BRH_c35]KJS66130.1 MAG: hypothetical protein JL55_37345 [[Pseudomonas] sp. BICA1-14]